MHKRLDMPPARLSQAAVAFAGLCIVQAASQGLAASQAEHAAAPEACGASSPPLTAVRAGRGGLGWAATPCRMGYACRAGQLAQAAQERASKAATAEASRAIAGLQSAKHWPLPHLPLDLPSCQLVALGDAPFASSHDSTSQAGCAAALCGKSGGRHVLHWCSRKIARAATPALTAEALALAAALDITCATREALLELLGRRLDLVMLADSHSLFSTALSCSAAKENRLLVGASCARQACRRYEIANVGLDRAAHVLVDPLTKDAPSAALDELLQAGCAPGLHVDKLASRPDWLSAGAAPIAEASAPVGHFIFFSEAC